jgi:prolyl-tRNA synthetase
VDERDDRTPGFKFNHWELRGVPIRIELGPRDLAANQAMVVERDTGAKTAVPLDQLAEDFPRRLEAIQARLLDAARERLVALTVDVDDWEALVERVARNAGWNRAWWCGDAACEERVKGETKATIRCIPFDQPNLERRAAELAPPACIVCGQAATQRVIMARAY